MKKIAFTLIAFCGLLLASERAAAQGSRQLFDSKTIADIRLTFPQKNWVDALDSMRLYGDGMLAAAVEIDGQKHAAAGARFRGNNSFQQGLKRNPMGIKVNFGDEKDAHQGHTSLKLSSALRDPSMIREALFFEIARKYTPAPRTSYAKLWVNEEPIGLFVLVESVDDKFCQTHFGPSAGGLFKASVDYPAKAGAGCKSNLQGAMEFEDGIECYRNNFEMESKDGWKSLQELTRVLTKSADKIESVLDVDRALWYLALSNVMVNLNSYLGQNSQNFYLFEDRNGRFQIVPWDLNLAFGSFKNLAGSDLDLGDLQKLDPLVHEKNPYKPLVSQLLKEPFYRKMYLAHVRQIVEENFENGWYERRAQELQGQIVLPFSEDKTKSYSLDDFQNSLKTTVGKKSKIPGIVELMSKRVRYLRSNAEISPLPPVLVDQKLAGREKLSQKTVSSFRVTARIDRFAKRAKIYYRHTPDAAWTSQWMDEDAAADAGAGKAFSATIDGKTDVLEYFIVGENAGAAACFPANYFEKPFVAKLSDLNK